MDSESEGCRENVLTKTNKVSDVHDAKSNRLNTFEKINIKGSESHIAGRPLKKNSFSSRNQLKKERIRKELVWIGCAAILIVVALIVPTAMMQKGAVYCSSLCSLIIFFLMARFYFAEHAKVTHQFQKLQRVIEEKLSLLDNDMNSEEYNTNKSIIQSSLNHTVKPIELNLAENELSDETEASDDPDFPYFTELPDGDEELHKPITADVRKARAQLNGIIRKRSAEIVEPRDLFINVCTWNVAQEGPPPIPSDSLLFPVENSAQPFSDELSAEEVYQNIHSELTNLPQISKSDYDLGLTTLENFNSMSLAKWLFGVSTITALENVEKRLKKILKVMKTFADAPIPQETLCMIRNQIKISLKVDERNSETIIPVLPDMFVVTLQETEVVSSGHLLSTMLSLVMEHSEVGVLWAETITECLNSVSTRCAVIEKAFVDLEALACKGFWGINELSFGLSSSKSKISPYYDVKARDPKHLYVKVHTVQLVGVISILFTTAQHVTAVKDVHDTVVRAGNISHRLRNPRSVRHSDVKNNVVDTSGGEEECSKHFFAFFLNQFRRTKRFLINLAYSVINIGANAGAELNIAFLRHLLGHKGSVIMSFTCYGKRFLCIGAHFDSSTFTVARRNSNYFETMQAITGVEFDPARRRRIKQERDRRQAIRKLLRKIQATGSDVIASIRGSRDPIEPEDSILFSSNSADAAMWARLEDIVTSADNNVTGISVEETTKLPVKNKKDCEKRDLLKRASKIILDASVAEAAAAGLFWRRGFSSAAEALVISAGSPDYTKWFNYGSMPFSAAMSRIAATAAAFRTALRLPSYQKKKKFYKPPLLFLEALLYDADETDSILPYIYQEIEHMQDISERIDTTVSFNNQKVKTVPHPEEVELWLPEHISTPRFDTLVQPSSAEERKLFSYLHKKIYQNSKGNYLRAFAIAGCALSDAGKRTRLTLNYLSNRRGDGRILSWLRFIIYSGANEVFSFLFALISLIFEIVHILVICFLWRLVLYELLHVLYHGVLSYLLFLEKDRDNLRLGSAILFRFFQVITPLFGLRKKIGTRSSSITTCNINSNGTNGSSVWNEFIDSISSLQKRQTGEQNSSDGDCDYISEASAELENFLSFYDYIFFAGDLNYRLGYHNPKNNMFEGKNIDKNAKESGVCSFDIGAISNEAQEGLQKHASSTNEDESGVQYCSTTTQSTISGYDSGISNDSCDLPAEEDMLYMFPTPAYNASVNNILSVGSGIEKSFNPDQAVEEQSNSEPLYLEMPIMTQSNLPRGLILSLIKSEQYELLLKYDQLRYESVMNHHIFQSFHEMKIAFPPTYKYDKNTYRTFDTGRKQRAPAWTDRILYRVSSTPSRLSTNVEKEYRRADSAHSNLSCAKIKGDYLVKNAITELEYMSDQTLLISDHQPLLARFSCKVVGLKKPGDGLKNAINDFLKNVADENFEE